MNHLQHRVLVAAAAITSFASLSVAQDAQATSGAAIIMGARALPPVVNIGEGRNRAFTDATRTWGRDSSLLAAAAKQPTFFARRDYTQYYSVSIQVADTNGDGIPDIIENEVGGVQVLFGNGDGTFRPGPNSATACSIYNFLAVDLTGNGIIDLITAPIGGNIGISLGNGDGTFQKGTCYPVGAGTSVGNPVVGDFNGDGILDVSITAPEGIWLFTGKGDGALNPGVLAVSLTGAEKLATADFNNDGKLDLTVTLPGGAGGFAVLLGNGNGTFHPPQMFSKPHHPIGLTTGVLTKGGHPSIAVTVTAGVYLYHGNGAGAFSGPRFVDLPEADGIAIGDLNGDGIADLVSEGGYIAFGTAGGAFKAPISHAVVSVQNNFYNVVLADLRNNGLTDIITDNYFGVSVLLSLGKGAYEEGEQTNVIGLAVSTPSGITILLGTGDAKSPFTTGSSITLAGASCPVRGDLNGDGIPDLLVPANGNPNTIYAYLGNGDGTFALKSATPTPNSGGYVVLADFSNDHKLDFATSGNLLALGNGDGTFQAPTAIVSNPPQTGFSNIATGDINNDGWPDLVLTNPGIHFSDTIFVLLNNHKEGFTQVPSNIGASTTQAILADLNGDGFLDLVLTPIGGAAVYLGDGRGSFTPGVVLVDPTPAPTFNMVADVNGDGIPDIEMLSGDTVAVFLGEGSAVYASPFEIGTGPSPGQILVENLHRQSPSAGLPDIVAPDGSGGVVVLINQTK